MVNRRYAYEKIDSGRRVDDGADRHKINIAAGRRLKRCVARNPAPDTAASAISEAAIMPKEAVP